MKRFVSYLYSIHNNQKIHNAGFARIELRTGRNRIDIHMRENGYSGKTGTVYLFVRNKDNIQGISIGNIMFRNNQADFRYEQAEENIGQTPWQIMQMNGILIFIDESAVFLSQWDELPVDTSKFMIWHADNVNENTDNEETEKKEQEDKSQNEMQIPGQNKRTDTQQDTVQDVNQGGVPVQNRNQSGAPVQETSQNSIPVQSRNQGNVPVQGRNQGRVPAQGQNQSGVPVQGRNQSGVPAQDQNQSGVPVQGRNQSSVPVQGRNQSSVPVQGRNQGNIPTQGRNQGSVPAQGRNQSSIPVQSRNQNGASIQSRSRNRVPVHGRNQSGIPVQDNQSSVPAKELNQSSIPEQDRSQSRIPVHQSSALVQGANQNNTSVQKINQNGVPLQGMNQNSSPVQGMNRNTVQRLNQGSSITQNRNQNAASVRTRNRNESLVPENNQETVRQADDEHINSKIPESMETGTDYGLTEAGTVQSELKEQMGEQISDIQTAELKPQAENQWMQTWRHMLRTYPVMNQFQDKSVLGVRIEIKDVRMLPEKYWSMVNNSFLLHGFFNYRYLIFGRIGQKWFIGIPGIYQNQEHAMASIFGFPDFLPREEKTEQGEQPGYWYRILEI